VKSAFSIDDGQQRTGNQACSSRPRVDEVVATEMALHVLAYNGIRILNIFGAKPIMAAVRA
jgi:hypothetical protein